MGLAFHSPVLNSLFSVPGSPFLPHWFRLCRVRAAHTSWGSPHRCDWYNDPHTRTVCRGRALRPDDALARRLC
jgi:hypothetical protein